MARSWAVVGGAAALMFTMAVAYASADPEKLTTAATDGSYTVDSASQADDVKVLETRDILTLGDDALVDAYINAAVEIEATKAFHSTSGFNPKQYKKYKALLKYRMQLLFELHRRKIEIPPALN